MAAACTSRHWRVEETGPAAEYRAPKTGNVDRLCWQPRALCVVDSGFTAIRVLHDARARMAICAWRVGFPLFWFANHGKQPGSREKKGLAEFTDSLGRWDWFGINRALRTNA